MDDTNSTIQNQPAQTQPAPAESTQADIPKKKPVNLIIALAVIAVIAVAGAYLAFSSLAQSAIHATSTAHSTIPASSTAASTVSTISNNALSGSGSESGMHYTLDARAGRSISNSSFSPEVSSGNGYVFCVLSEYNSPSESAISIVGPYTDGAGGSSDCTPSASQSNYSAEARLTVYDASNFTQTSGSSYTIPDGYAATLMFISVACNGKCVASMPAGCQTAKSVSTTGASVIIGVCENQTPGSYRVVTNPSGAQVNTYLFYEKGSGTTTSIRSTTTSPTTTARATSATTSSIPTTSTIQTGSSPNKTITTQQLASALGGSWRVTYQQAILNGTEVSVNGSQVEAQIVSINFGQGTETPNSTVLNSVWMKFPNSQDAAIVFNQAVSSMGGTSDQATGTSGGATYDYAASSTNGGISELGAYDGQYYIALLEYHGTFTKAQGIQLLSDQLSDLGIS